MHRSGTSLVAHLLYLCGVYLGPDRDLAGPAPDNLDGFWENVHFVALNDQILAHLGGGWDLVPDAPPHWESGAGLRELRAAGRNLVRELGARPPWGWKDPRNSLTLPFWRALVPALKVVVCVRNPVDVAGSLQRRGYSSERFGLDLWLRYNLAIRAAAPAGCVVTHYESYFHDASAELARVMSSLGLEVAPETLAGACTAVSGSLRHGATRLPDLLGRKLPSGLADCYASLCADGGEVLRDALAASGARRAPTAEPEARRRVRTSPAGAGRAGAGPASTGEADAERAFLVAARDVAAADCETARRARDQAVVERLAALSLRDQAAAERDAALVARDRAFAEREAARAARDQADIDRLAAQSARDHANAERETASAAREQAEHRRLAALAERDAALSARDEAAGERDAALSARDEAAGERDAALSARDEAVGERDAAVAERGAALVSLAQEEAALQSARAGRASAEQTLATAAREHASLVAELETRMAAGERRSQEVGLQLAAAQRTLVEIWSSRAFWPVARYWMAASAVKAGARRSLRALRRALDGVTRGRQQPDPVPRTIPAPEPAHAPSPVVAAAAVAGTGGEAAPAALPAPAFVRARGAYDVVFFPIIDWEFRFQRPQQLARGFSRRGHRVFYLRTRFDAGLDAPRLEPLLPGVTAVRLPGPDEVNLYQHRLDGAALSRTMEGLSNLRRTTGMGETVCVVQLPFWGAAALEARERWGWKVVYDCMDEHAGFSTNADTMLGQETALLRDSDLVMVTAKLLKAKADGTARRVALVPNAADFLHFSERPGARPLAEVAHPIVGYYGAISDWFDVEMIRAAALARPDWSFVLIGSTFGAEVKPLLRLVNVHLLGEKPYDELPGYLHEFDVACIPFLQGPLTLATNPVKFFEYLSAGKPVVAVALPELEPYTELLYPVREPGQFVPQLVAALGEQGADRREARVRLARENTWDQRVESAAAAIGGLFGRVAVVVVSFNNAAYLRQCLDSVLAETRQPNLEVVVVDNASGPEVTGYLRNMAARESRVKVLFNESNLGFARANNLGIEAAGECEYVVLLNDDTVVTPGWLQGLLRHLEDRNVGLVGPVTSWAGNEARVDVPYQKIEDMPAFALRYVQEHEGRCFDIAMLAMFCVAMRRSTLDTVGMLDERFGIGMFEDDDFALRIRAAGLRVVCAEDVFVHHWGRASFGRIEQAEYDRIFAENRRKFEAKWARPWQAHQSR
jgi:GT2 family glycosyltransferase